MYDELGISKETIEYVNKQENELKDIFFKLDQQCDNNSLKVLSSFHKFGISEYHLNGSTGYGFSDIGRETIDKIFADILGCEDALVRNQMITGTTALSTTLFALLRPNDILLSISGTPYDSLHEVIGIIDNPGSLKTYGIKYEEIDLIDNDFNYAKIKEYLNNNKVKVIEIQRSKGYSTRKSITIEKIEKVVKEIRNIDKDVIIMVDNCYCEFVEDKNAIDVGCDIMVGSLMKNLGGGIAETGSYVAGKHNLVELVASQLTAPGEGREIGPTFMFNKQILKGLYFAPSTVCSSLKTAILTAKCLEGLGYKVEPKYNDLRADIVQNIEFGNRMDMIKYCQGIQMASAIDSNAIPEPCILAGYSDEIIMASGSFTQGSTIELSCDGPLREPYIAYQQGGLTYSYGKLAIMKAIDRMKENNENK